MMYTSLGKQAQTSGTTIQNGTIDSSPFKGKKDYDQKSEELP